MNAITPHQNSQRLLKLSLCLIINYLAFIGLFYDVTKLDNIDVLLWLLVYLTMTIVIFDIFKTLPKGKRIHWVLINLCMPVIGIPVYIIYHGKN